MVKSISVIIPSYNEEENIKELYERIVKVLDEIDINDYEIIFIENGSSDKSLDILKNINLRRFSIGDWIFDIKQVRALKAPVYGVPYSATGMMTLNGASAYIDTFLTKDYGSLSRKDFTSMTTASKLLGTERLTYDRIKPNLKRSESLDLTST